MQDMPGNSAWKIRSTAPVMEFYTLDNAFFPAEAGGKGEGGKGRLARLLEALEF